MEITDKEKAMIKSALRRVFGWSSQYREVKRRAHVEKNLYRCEGCEQLIFKIHSRASEAEFAQVAHYAFPEKLYVDHINPVAPVENVDDDMKNLLERLFCGENGLQYLCESCHYIKTQIENKERRENKK